MQIISCNISQKLNSSKLGKAFNDLGFEKMRTKHSRGYKYAGVAEDGSALYYNKNGETTSAPTDEDKQELGSGIPKFTYGITRNAEYKGFDLTVFGTCLLYTSASNVC